MILLPPSSLTKKKKTETNAQHQFHTCCHLFTERNNERVVTKLIYTDSHQTTGKFWGFIAKYGDAQLSSSHSGRNVNCLHNTVTAD